jgi:protein-tyrosine-phosphatase
MKKVVFICRGNLFRSQVAKAFYNQLVKDGSRAESYGTWVEEEGNQGLKLSLYPGLEILITEIKKYGLDISNEHCEQLKEEYLKDADKIIVMAEKEFIPNWLEKYEYEYWENIPNPEAHTVLFMEGAIKLIRGKVLELIN